MTITRDKKYIERFYRKELHPEDLIYYSIKIKESDILICSSKYLKKEATEILKRYRGEIEEYIKRDPLFTHTLKPHEPIPGAPLIVKKMAEAGKKCRVGPMASVAGAIGEFLGLGLLQFTNEVIVENGGDLFIETEKMRKVGIFAGDSAWSNKLVLKISPEDTPLGICTSSGKIGHSLSFGTTDAVVIVSDSAILSDAVATAVGNMVKSPADIQRALQYCRKIGSIRGVIIVKGKNLGIWGDLELEEL